MTAPPIPPWAASSRCRCLSDRLPDAAVLKVPSRRRRAPRRLLLCHREGAAAAHERLPRSLPRRPHAQRSARDVQRDGPLSRRGHRPAAGGRCGVKLACSLCSFHRRELRVHPAAQCAPWRARCGERRRREAHARGGGTRPDRRCDLALHHLQRVMLPMTSSPARRRGTSRRCGTLRQFDNQRCRPWTVMWRLANSRTPPRLRPAARSQAAGVTGSTGLVSQRVEPDVLRRQGVPVGAIVPRPWAWPMCSQWAAR